MTVPPEDGLPGRLAPAVSPSQEPVPVSSHGSLVAPHTVPVHDSHVCSGVLSNGHHAPASDTFSRFGFAFNREDIVRLLMQSLVDLGYRSSVQTLKDESSVSLEIPAASHLRQAVLQRDWQKAIEQLRLVHFVSPESRQVAQFLLYKELFLELIHQKKFMLALKTLRTHVTVVAPSSLEVQILSERLFASNNGDATSAPQSQSHTQTQSQRIGLAAPSSRQITRQRNHSRNHSRSRHNSTRSSQSHSQLASQSRSTTSTSRRQSRRREGHRMRQRSTSSRGLSQTQRVTQSQGRRESANRTRARTRISTSSQRSAGSTRSQIRTRNALAGELDEGEDDDVDNSNRTSQSYPHTQTSSDESVSDSSDDDDEDDDNEFDSDLGHESGDDHERNETFARQLCEPMTPKEVLESIEEHIISSELVRRDRLFELLAQASTFQRQDCVCAPEDNPSASVITDHICTNEDFPDVPDVVLDQFAEKRKEVWFVSFSNSGDYLAAAGQDKVVLVYETKKFTVHHRLEAHEGPVRMIEWAKNDETLLVCCDGHGPVQVFDMQTGELAFHIVTDESDPIATYGPGKRCITVGFSHANRLAVHRMRLSAGHALEVTEEIDLPTSPVQLRYTPDYKTLVYSGQDRRVHALRMYDERDTVILAATSMVTSISLSKDGSLVLVNLGTQVVKLVRVRSGELIRDFTGHMQGRFTIRSCFAGAREHLIVSGSEDGKVYVWQRDQGTVFKVLDRHFGASNDVVWHPSRTLLASCGDDGLVVVWRPTPSSAPQHRCPQSNERNDVAPRVGANDDDDGSSDLDDAMIGPQPFDDASVILDNQADDDDRGEPTEDITTV